MGLYRKKPVVVEAWQFDGTLASVESVLASSNVLTIGGPAGTLRVEIKAQEGALEVVAGDWIIRRADGTLYRCTPDYFAATYEPADAETAIARNQVIPAPMVPGNDSILEMRDGPGDVFEQLGPPVVIKPYKRPKDPRVQQALDDAEAARRAEAMPEWRMVFSDPRLDPNYRPPKFKR
jgi:phosphoglycolate phosphatase-like HAD superfamily hydrolase